MTKQEYNDRLIALQKQLADDLKDETARHAAAIGKYRAGYRTQTRALWDQFREEASEETLRDRTIIRPV
jgi:hypothetical protein